MIQDLQLRGFSERTQEMYVRAVRQLAEHYHKSPDQITEEELRQYFLYIKNVKHYSRSASTIALCSIKFFFEHTLHRDWPTLTFVRAPRENKLPVLLSPQEVQRVLHAVRLPRYRVCLTTIYSCGLRLKEGTHLQVPDIDSSRMVIHVHRGKGAKDRYVPLPKRSLELLRQYWKTHRNPIWLFPAPGRGGIGMSTAQEPMPRSSVQKLFYDLLFKTSSQALQELAADPRFVGGAIGMMGGLHTWARDLAFHPHVHYIVPGGGISEDHSKWLPSHKRFFLHVKPLSRLSRAKFKDELKKTSSQTSFSPKYGKRTGW